MKKTIATYTMKKILSFILILLVVLPMCISAYADESDFLDSASLNNWMDQYIGDNGLSGNGKAVSVGFIYTKTGDEYYYNADVFMYSASLYKVPVCMMLAEHEAAGEITQQTQIVGNLTTEYLEYTALVNSNNDSGHYVADYIGTGVSEYDTYSGKDADLAVKYAPSLEASYYNEDFYEISYYSARFMTQVMNTLYNGGDMMYPHIIEYLKQAQPDNYFNLSMKGKYAIAQKYGAFEERNGTIDNHCAAIIYTPTPIIVVVMTKNIGPYEKTIADIGSYLAEYAVQLDSKPVPTPTPEPTIAPSPTVVPLQTIEPTPQPSTHKESGKFPFYLLLIIPVLLVVIILLKFVKTKDDDDEEYEVKEKRSRHTSEEPQQKDDRKQKGKYIPKH